MKSLSTLLILFLFGSACSLYAQDTLFYKNGSRQTVKILEVGLDDLKYRDYQSQDAPVFAVDKSDLKKVVFADGNKLVFEEDILSLTISSDAAKKTNAIKFEFFSPLYASFGVGFEHLIKKGVALETKAGAIGPGFDPGDENPGGGYLRVGVKFMNSPDYYVRGMKRTHPLRGGYIKPEFTFSKFGVDRMTDSYNYGTTYPYYTTYTQTTTRVNYTNYAFNLIFGKQRILGDIMTFDWYVGVGYGFQTSDYEETNLNSNVDEDLSYYPRAYSFLYGGKDFPMTFTGGMTLGFLFK